MLQPGLSPPNRDKNVSTTVLVPCFSRSWRVINVGLRNSAKLRLGDQQHVFKRKTILNETLFSSLERFSNQLGGINVSLFAPILPLY